MQRTRTTRHRSTATSTRHQIRGRRSLDRLTGILKREGMTLGDVRHLLLPPDPWEAARGIWAGRRQRAERAQKKLRKEWNRA